MGIAGESSFGNNVRRLRESSGMTQENLAEAAGLDRSYIGGIERGERNPALAAILRLASALGIAPAELFNGIGGNRQNVARSILDRWDFTDEELTQLIDGNPSLRGMALGYLAELKLERLWLSDPRFSEVSNTMTMTEAITMTAWPCTREGSSPWSRSLSRLLRYREPRKVGLAEPRWTLVTVARWRCLTGVP